MEEIKLQIQSLYTLRNTYINILALLIGGVVCLCFVVNKQFIVYLFLITGCSTILFLSFIIYTCINKLDKLFKELKEIEK